MGSNRALPLRLSSQDAIDDETNQSCDESCSLLYMQIDELYFFETHNEPFKSLNTMISFNFEFKLQNNKNYFIYNYR